MVFLYKRMCALCGALPPAEPESSYPDMRENEELFVICRAFKVTRKRKCPVCPECTVEIARAAEFMAKCCRTQDFLFGCCHRKLIEDDEILEFREESLGQSGASRQPNVLLNEKKREPGGDEKSARNSPEEFVEIIKESIITEEGNLSENGPEQFTINPASEEEETFEAFPDIKQDVDSDDDDDFETPNEEPVQASKERERPRKVLSGEDDKSTVKVQRKRGRPRRADTKPRTYKHNIKCRHCERVLHSETQWRTHEKQHELQSERKAAHVCDQCGKSFKSPSLLRDHYTKHSDERPFPCDQCGTGFKTAYGLRNHMETHSEQKHICPTCGLALQSRHTYSKHLKVHSDVRNYKCIVCPKTFKRHQPLKEHMLSHTDIRPYQCCFCPSTFVDGSSARQHKVRVHPKELAELEASGRNEEVLQQYRNIPTIEEVKAMLCAKFGLDDKTYQPLVPGK